MELSTPAPLRFRFWLLSTPPRGEAAVLWSSNAREGPRLAAGTCDGKAAPCVELSWGEATPGDRTPPAAVGPPWGVPTCEPGSTSGVMPRFSFHIKCCLLRISDSCWSSWCLIFCSSRNFSIVRAAAAPASLADCSATGFGAAVALLRAFAGERASFEALSGEALALARGLDDDFGVSTPSCSGGMSSSILTALERALWGAWL
mmetsp:Transcript_2578/g.6088  ORF Transcript_2578/g.6088 Transcript_2578/m.6088 type:complete len:203 (-) Transcript_2578:2968-3576(-)